MKGNNPTRKRWPWAAALCALALVAGGTVFCCATGSGAPGETAVRETVLTNFSDDLGVPSQLEFVTISLGRADLCRGSLALVNRDTPWPGGEPDSLVNVYENGGKGYSLSGSDLRLQEDAMGPFNEMMASFAKITGFDQVMVSGCYRSEAAQEALYEEAVETYGDKADTLAARPGYSDFHTGCSVDLRLYTGGKVLDFLGTGDCDWLLRNCNRFGFVVRYPEGKEDITGYGYQPYHLRYVGRPHGYLMGLKQYCLEEYLDYLTHYPFDGNHVQVTDNENHKYEIYYVAAAGDRTDVPVPKDDPYTVSGDNRGGFIVTVELD